VLLLFSMGIVVIFSTSSAEVLDMELEVSTHHALFKQLSYGIVGAIAAYTLKRMGYHRFLVWSPYLFVLITVLLVMTLIPGVGREVNGSRRWLGVGGIYFQPSEFAKYIVPAYAIYRFVISDDSPINLKKFLLTSGICSVPLFLVLVEPNNGTMAVMALSLVVVFILMKVPFKFWGMPLLILTVVGGAFASQLPYVTGRMQVYLNPELDLRGKGHQPYQAKIAAGSGGLLGKGPGKSLQKLSYLPEAQNDYIAAIFAEEYGFIGVMLLITTFMLLTSLGYLIASKAAFLPGFYLGAVVTFLLSFQAFLNLGVVSGLLPSTGLNLPFFSQGGTSLIANFMAVGLLISVAADRRTESC
jgi:cell division protein FtsW